MTATQAAGSGELVDGNPFSTRHIRPGAIPYLFASKQGRTELKEKLQANGWRGEIVGPHGCGKSTLLATLLPELERAGRIVFHITVREGERRLPVSKADWQAWTSNTQVVIDGYEQLGWWQRRWLDGVCRRSGAGLLVTAHESVGLPHLIRVVLSLETMQAVVARLLPAGCPCISPEDVARVYREKGGNARETLFGLYDLYELRRR